MDSEDAESERSAFSSSQDDEDDDATPLARPRSSYMSRSSHKIPSPPPSVTPRQRMTRSSVEPEFIMPSMRHESPTSATQRGSPKRSQRLVPEKTATRKVSAQKEKGTRKPRRGDGWKSSVASGLAASLGPLLYGVWLWIQPFVSFGIAAFILGYVLFTAKSWVGSLLFRPFSPLAVASVVCNWPIVGFLPFCPNVPKANVNPEFDQLVTVQGSFEDVLSSASSYAFLPIDMKRSEASIRDLKHVVQYSNLPSRNELVFEFEGFIEMAQQAGFDLTKFNSHVGRALDHITSTNRRTLQVMHGEADREAGRGALARLVWDGVPSLFGFQTKTVDRILTTQYLLHISAVEDELARLILEAQALLSILSNLDSRIDVIASVTTRDGVKLSGSRDELLSSLYTYLGGNRGSIKKLDEQLRLLRDVSVYRKNAWNHVNAALLKLQAIQAGLEDLRERVAEPDVLGGVVVPLEQHLEHVRMGVDRLELIRNEQRKVDDANLRRVLEHGGPSNDRLVEGRSMEGKVGR